VLGVTVCIGRRAPVFVRVSAPEAPDGYLDVQLRQDELLIRRPSGLAVVEQRDRGMSWSEVGRRGSTARRRRYGGRGRSGRPGSCGSPGALRSRIVE
jgi:hypothetical protein